MEILVTTIPILKFPFHLSYSIYLSNISIGMMKFYLNIALSLCKLTRTPVSFLLHPLEIVDGDQIKQLAFFPGMNIKTENKVNVFKTVLKELKFKFSIVSMPELINTDRFL